MLGHGSGREKPQASAAVSRVAIMLAKLTEPREWTTGRRCSRSTLPVAGEREVADRVVPDELLVDDRVRVLGGAPGGVEGGDDGARARARHPVDHDAGPLELVEGPEVRERAGAAAGQDESDRALGEPG